MYSLERFFTPNDKLTLILSVFNSSAFYEIVFYLWKEFVLITLSLLQVHLKADNQHWISPLIHHRPQLSASKKFLVINIPKRFNLFYGILYFCLKSSLEAAFLDAAKYTCDIFVADDNRMLNDIWKLSVVENIRQVK